MNLKAERHARRSLIERVSRFSLSLLLSAVGCASVSLTDTEYFLEAPYVLERTNDYVLRWRYGSAGASFEPKAKVVDGRLEFSFQGSPKDGFRSGEYDELSITNQLQLDAFKSGGAYWVQPDGSRVRLDVRKF